VVTSIYGFMLIVDFNVKMTGPKRDLKYKFHQNNFSCTPVNNKFYVIYVYLFSNQTVFHLENDALSLILVADVITRETNFRVLIFICLNFQVSLLSAAE
jgi:hypothetical protein